MIGMLGVVRLDFKHPPVGKEESYVKVNRRNHRRDLIEFLQTPSDGGKMQKD